MRLLPEKVSELDPNFRWSVETHLQILEEIVLGPPVSGSDAPTMEEAEERMGRAVVLPDRKAEDEAIADYMRAELRAWWQDLAEQRLLSNLYRRAARRTVATGSRDSRRPLHTMRTSGLPRRCFRTSKSTTSAHSAT